MKPERELIQAIAKWVDKPSKWNDFEKITIKVEKHSEKIYWCDGDYTVVLIHLANKSLLPVRLEKDGVFKVKDNDITELIRKELRNVRFGL